MRFDFSLLLVEIERRFRLLGGFALGARWLLYASIACLAAGLALRVWGPEMWLPIRIAEALLPLPLAAIAFAVGWRRRPDLPALLLRLDDELGSGARMSSLYEVRAKGHSPFIRERLEQLVALWVPRWREGLPVPRRCLGFVSSGVAGMLLAAAILLVPLPFLQAEAPAIASESETSGGHLSTLGSTASAPGGVEAAADDDVAAPLEVLEEAPLSQRGAADTPAPDGANEELSLDSILEDLSSLSRGQVQVDAPATSEELAELAQAQQDARQALSEMLRDLMEQMQAQPRPLTQQESQTLQDLASQTGDPEIEEQTDEIVNEPDPSQIGEKLQDLLEEADPNATEPETDPNSEEEAPPGSGEQSPRSTEVTGDQEAGQRFLERTAEQLQEQADAEAQQDETGQEEPGSPTEPSDTESDPSSEGAVARGEDDVSRVGGDEGAAGASGSEPPAGELGFVREEAPVSIGSEGEAVDEFITKGVPVEIVAEDGQPVSRSVDFERMESILRERGLPDEALDSVRRYFEMITRPEGGS